MKLWTGLSALQANQFAINTISHNLANASTEGYHRQDVELKTSQPQRIQNLIIGKGVEVSDVRRMRDGIVEGSYTNSLGDLGSIEQRLRIEERIESFLLPGEGSIQNSLTGMFDEMSRLTANPGEKTLRSSVVNKAVNLAQHIRGVSNGLVELKDSVSRQISLEVESLNQDLASLVELQNRIGSSGGSRVSNDLLDQRDQLINKIAKRVDVQRYESVQNSMGLSIAGNSISLGATAVQFEAVRFDDGSIEIRTAGSAFETKFASGSIEALTNVHNNLIDQVFEKVGDFASELIHAMDQVHSAGVGLDGPFSVLRSTRLFTDIDVPLIESGIAFPVEAGELFFSVTSPTGERRTEMIEIDPATDSMKTIAAKISGLENVQAVVDKSTGQLSIAAAPGFRFDFTGNLETTPDLASFSGTSVPRIEGIYQGEVNRNLTVTTIGSGTIGKTPGLRAQVTDEDGQVIKEFNIGDGYEAGSDVEITEGVTLSFGVGEVNDGDSFDTTLVARSDQTGILSALGLNSFFHGNDATDIAVNSSIVENPDRISTTRSGDIGDTSNLAGLVSLRNEHVLGNGRMTFDDFLAETSAEIGFKVQSSQSIQISVSEINFQFQAQRDSVSGVDINEELLNLSRYQKSYEAAVQVVRTMEAMFDELFQIIR